MNSSQLPDYNTLVMSGGGIKGLGLLGALQYLADRNKLYKIHKFIGTSVGAIIGYLLSIGYSPIEIMVTINQKQIIEKMVHGLNMIDLIHHGGALNYFILHEFLEDMTITKVGHVLTMRQLYDEFGKHLICCTFNHSTRQCEYLDYISNPHLPCLTALRMSSTLPFLFRPFPYEGSLYLDGAILDNFPVCQLTQDDIAIAIRLTRECPNGTRKDTMNSFPKNEKKKRHKPNTSFDLMSYILEIIYIPIESAHRYSSLTAKHKPVDTIDVVVDIPVFHFHMSMTEKFNNFSIGYETVKRYYQKSFIILWTSTIDEADPKLDE